MARYRVAAAWSGALMILRHDRMQSVQQSELIFHAANQPRQYRLLQPAICPACRRGCWGP